MALRRWPYYYLQLLFTKIYLLRTTSFILSQLGLILNTRTPPFTTGMHQYSRASRHLACLNFSIHTFVSIVDVPLQTSVCLVRLSTCFTSEHLSIRTLNGLLHSPLIRREVLVSLVSLKASLCLVSGSTSVTNIRFFNHGFSAFTILEQS